ncbi:30S ribosomal protein S12 methylthiotransferase RimO [Saccharicrinis sp. FJH62]|uniref:30S ribosomal protein S12 methylthiotransferase RimO n=1 Tax=Saccharicrinis sp. FJH62 TaxID=3344657 RepID=UPI0035D502A9
MRKKVSVITMGCSKNLVDSEVLLQKFSDNGFDVEHDPETVTGDIVVVNTCGFIGDAKEESVNMILQLADARTNGDIEKLYVMGCLSERYMEDLNREIPEVDKYFGKFNWNKVIDELVENKKYKESTSSNRYVTTPSHFAYLKISEGCNRSCAYCAIPLITGKHKSVPIDKLVEEATQLASKGVKELQVIAQDLSYYGLDLYKKHKLAELVTALSEIQGIEWIRLHYAYPAGFPFEILEVMRTNPKVCTYLDIAFQHISDNMLKKMKRQVSKQQTYDLIRKIRTEVPGIHLRTTLMTGFPGETEEDFQELVQFVKDIRFERLGVFPYSEEDGTYAGDHLTDDISEEVKLDRAEKLMAVQEEIANELSVQKEGQELKVMIDRKEADYYIGRTEFDSPEVDPEVLVSGKNLNVGSFYTIKITGAESYDLIGEVIS